MTFFSFMAGHLGGCVLCRETQHIFLFNSLFIFFRESVVFYANMDKPENYDFISALRINF